MIIEEPKLDHSGFNNDDLIVRFRKYCQGDNGAITEQELKDMQFMLSRIYDGKDLGYLSLAQKFN
jgi:hypothetical protein